MEHILNKNNPKARNLWICFNKLVIKLSEKRCCTIVEK